MKIAHLGSAIRLVVLVIKPSGRAGRFLGYVDDELIVTSRQPFLDGARALLARGYDPATPYNMRHVNSDVLSFVMTTIGHSAGLSVSEARSSHSSGRRQRRRPNDEPLQSNGQKQAGGRAYRRRKPVLKPPNNAPTGQGIGYRGIQKRRQLTLPKPIQKRGTFALECRARPVALGLPRQTPTEPHKSINTGTRCGSRAEIYREFR
jgi:hypothetical protein